MEPLRKVRMTVSLAEVSWLRAARCSSAMPPSVKTFARPQSITCTSPNAPTMMLAGFRSRWITPLACA
jgi:hypothetical protein